MISLENLVSNGNITLSPSHNNQPSYVDSSMECARYIMDSECEQVSYEEYIQEGNDPRDHILYHAAIVLGLGNEFENDITEFLKETS